MTEPVRDMLTKLLKKVGIRAAQIGSDKPLLADGEFHFVSSWHFEVNVKDSIIRNVLNSETVVDEQALTEFERFNRAQLVKDVDIKSKFCQKLQTMPAREIFKLGNKVNRLSVRKAIGRCSCPKCNGTKRTSCPNCSGYGQILCPSCQGAEGGCSRCKRTGYVPCPTCRSEGSIPCQKCRGIGIILVERQVFLTAINNSSIFNQFTEIDD